MQNSEKIREIEKDEITGEIENKNVKISALSANIVRLLITLIILCLLLILKGCYYDGFEKMSEYYKTSPYIMFKEEKGIIVTE